jgi:host cell surface-exposed lipoprotein
LFLIMEENSMKIRTVAFLVGGVMALAGAVACGGGGTPDPTPTTPAATTRPPVRTTAPTHPSSSPTPTSPAPSSAPPIGLKTKTRATDDYRNALSRATTYLLDDTGFSRASLIRQLKFEGFPTSVATLAIDDLHPDWNAQASFSAEGYRSTTAFSRAGLIKQLTSSAVGFTHAQAVYGVDHKVSD